MHGVAAVQLQNHSNFDCKTLEVTKYSHSISTSSRARALAHSVTSLK